VRVTSYDIYRDGVQVGSSTTPRFTDVGLQSSKTYSYTIVAKDLMLNASAPSQSFSATTRAPDTQAPTAPTSLKASSITQTSMVLTWGASKDNLRVAAYDIYRNGTKIGSSTTARFAVSGLTKATAYSYYIVALDTSGNISTSSSTLNVSTKN
jgi:chitodextrinase